MDNEISPATDMETPEMPAPSMSVYDTWVDKLFPDGPPTIGDTVSQNITFKVVGVSDRGESKSVELQAVPPGEDIGTGEDTPAMGGETCEDCGKAKGQCKCEDDDEETQTLGYNRKKFMAGKNSGKIPSVSAKDLED